MVQKLPGTPGLTHEQVHEQVCGSPAKRHKVAGIHRTKSTKSQGFIKLPIQKNKSLSLRPNDVSHLVSAGFCLTRNFLFGIPISAALIQ